MFEVEVGRLMRRPWTHLKVIARRRGLIVTTLVTVGISNGRV